MGRKIHRDPASSRTRDLVNTRQMLLPLSCWTLGGVVEASLATARLEASVTLAVAYTAYSLGWLAVQAHCLSRNTHYPPPQPLVSLATPFTKGAVCETIFSLSMHCLDLKCWHLCWKIQGICIITPLAQECKWLKTRWWEGLEMWIYFIDSALKSKVIIPKRSP